MNFGGQKIVKIAIGCDHGALNLKKVLIDHLETKGFEIKDFEIGRAHV